MLEKLHQATDVGSRRTSRIDDVAFPCDEESSAKLPRFTRILWFRAYVAELMSTSNNNANEVGRRCPQVTT